jgi:hypothetical protein
MSRDTKQEIEREAAIDDFRLSLLELLAAGLIFVVRGAGQVARIVHRDHVWQHGEPLPMDEAIEEINRGAWEEF